MTVQFVLSSDLTPQACEAYDIMVNDHFGSKTLASSTKLDLSC